MSPGVAGSPHFCFEVAPFSEVPLPPVVEPPMPVCAVSRRCLGGSSKNTIVSIVRAVLVLGGKDGKDGTNVGAVASSATPGSWFEEVAGRIPLRRWCSAVRE